MIKQLKITKYISIVNNSISILLEYTPENTSPSVFIVGLDTTIEGIAFNQGDAGVTWFDNTELIANFVIDSNGNLILDHPNANQFSIDANGYLIRTT